MADHIRIRKSDGKWVVRAGGSIIGESGNVQVLSEGDFPDVIYFPRDDIAMAFLDASDHKTTCPHKGEASYLSIDTKSTVLENAVWSYENPVDAVAAIKGYLAFDRLQVTVEEL
jgi:uncharacterized protein (DUF427 family)